MSTKSIVGIPTLHSISNPVLTKQEDVAAYLIRFMFANPGGTSSTAENEMMSFRKLVARYGVTDPNRLADAVAGMLTESFRRYFPDSTVSAGCSIEYENGTGEDGAHLGNYGITINFHDTSNRSICPISKFVVDKKGDTLDVRL